MKKTLALAIFWLSGAAWSAGLDVSVVNHAEQWLETTLAVPQNGSDAARVLKATSVLEALPPSGETLDLRLMLLASLDNTELTNNDLYARSQLAGVLSGDSVSSMLADSFRQFDAGYAGWGLSGAYLSSPLDTALVLRAIGVAGNEAHIAAAIAYLVAAQQANGSWLNAEGGSPSIMATSQAVLALQRFVASHASAQTAINKAIPYLQAVPSGSGALVRAQAALALLRVQGDTAQVDYLARELAAEQQLDGSWGGDVFTTATVVELLNAVLGESTSALETPVVINDAAAREVINTALGKNAYDQVTLGDLRQLMTLDLIQVVFTDLSFLKGAVATQSLALPGNYQLSASDIGVLLSLPNLTSLWIGGQLIDMTQDADQDALPDGLELLLGTNPNKADTDNDKLPDGWEVRYGFNPTSLPGMEETHLDPDGDNADNFLEYLEGTDPKDANSQPRSTVGLVAYYPMTQGSAMPTNRLLDVSWFSETPVDLMLSGSAGFISGAHGVKFAAGGMASSSGSTQQLRDAMTLNDSFSIELWVKSDITWGAGYVNPVLFAYSSAPASRNVGIFQTSSDDMDAYVNDGVSTPLSDPVPVASNQLEHYVLTFDHGTKKIYRNGYLVHMVDDDSSIANAWGALASLSLANETGGTAQSNWHGEMYQLAIYNRALKPSEVANHYMLGDQPTDADGDGLPNIVDFKPLEPQNYDTDGDGVRDVFDNCPQTANAAQTDYDADGIGDACDEDNDNDGIPNDVELANGLDPYNPADADADWDGDGLNNRYELLNGLDINNAADADADPDGDGLTSRDEILSYGTAPFNVDTDGDGIADGDEVLWELDPLDASDALQDADGDGLMNIEEINLYDTSPNNPDTDGDGVNDWVEKKVLPWLVPVITNYLLS